MSLMEMQNPYSPSDIKPEPEEGRLSVVSSPSRSLTAPIVKPEPTEVSHFPSPEAMLNLQGPIPSGSRSVNQVVTPSRCYKVYTNVDEIQYLPENALKEGLGMVKTLKTSMQRLNLGNKMRQDVWRDEIEKLSSQGAPTTMIAVCGATGAGKSSILNAILDDNIVPTSGMRACTAVVTEIRYHKKRTIDGDVSFLTEQEWRDELKLLLDDLVDEDGNVKRSTDLRSDAGIAWSKVHAVYPSISQKQLVRMSVDQILAHDPKIAKLLGTTKHVSAPHSKTFSKEISKYIDSKDRKRGHKKDKDNRKARERDNNPAYWPLIRQVRVWCNANALSTGAVLVDLPGVADANAARNNIAKDYMKKCACVWILAPITRAVDDKTARDLMGDAFKMQLMMGDYDANAITFIATKCDDISCSEVIRALGLDDDLELEQIEDEIKQCKSESRKWQDRKAGAEAAAKDVKAQLQQSRDILAKYKEHLEALQKGQSSRLKFTAKKGKAKLNVATVVSDESESDTESSSESEKENKDEQPKGKKRKNKRDLGQQTPVKRRRQSVSSDEEDTAMAVDDDDDFIVEDELHFSHSDEVVDNDTSSSSSDSDSDVDSEPDRVNQGAEEEEEEVTPEILKKRIEDVKQVQKDGRMQQVEFKRQRKEASDMLATVKKRQNEAQRRKNTFCSLKRSTFSRDVLKEDFRTGLKDLDDAEQERKNPTTFDPTVNIRDYDAIDLPVFTCSARDYIRIKGQVRGDGDPTCFTKVDDTGIPKLQKWCHHLTASSRSRAARNFFTHLTSFTKNVHIYLQGIGNVTDADRAAMKEKWESDTANNTYEDMAGSADSRHILELNMFAVDSVFGLVKQEKLGPDGVPTGITPRLTKDFKRVVNKCVAELKNRFKDDLEEKCQIGATNAAAAAVETSDRFAASMHWATYRAILRRHGVWQQDLNIELTNPFTRQIASAWSKVFEADLLMKFKAATLEVVEKLIADVEASAALGLKERAKCQGERCLEEACGVLRSMIDIVNETLSQQQKEASRCFSPHVQKQLVDGYVRAVAERGRGSVARQKAIFHNYVDEVKGQVFTDAANVIMVRLSEAAEAVGQALQGSLDELARKIEVGMAVLWEAARDDPEQVTRARREVVKTVSEILEQVELWKSAERVSHMMLTYTNQANSDMDVLPPPAPDASY